MPSTSLSPGTGTADAANRPRRVLYGRRAGPRLKPSQQKLLAERLPELAITLPPSGVLHPASCFSAPPAKLALEIGFGGGEHLAFQARRHPDTGFLGVEPYVNGVASLLTQIEALKLTNIRILQDDARLLFNVLAPNSLARIFVLFPDPWPKTRHHKRRIVNAETIASMAQALEQGGELRLASDDPGYVRWMLALALGEPRLSWLAKRPGDWRQRPADWPETRYERKAGAAGRSSVFLRFQRV